MVLKKGIKGIIKCFLGKRKLQSLFETLYNLSLYGMNIGGGLTLIVAVKYGL